MLKPNKSPMLSKTKELLVKPIILNQEILRDIFIKIRKVESQWSGDADKVDTENLAKFMLAGKETFKIVLNFFAKANFADIGYRRRKYGDIDEAQAYVEDLNESSVVVGFINSKNEYERYRFSLDFKLMKPLIVAVGEGILELIIRDCRPPILSNIINTLMKKNLKKVSLLRDPPKPIYDFLKQSEIKSIEICSFDEDSDLSILPLSCHELQITFDDIKNILQLKSKNAICPFIEKLKINGQISNYEFNPRVIKQLVLFICKFFPNTKELNTDIGIYCNWWEIETMVFSLKPSMFQGILPHVKGKIRFFIDEDDEDDLFDTFPDVSIDPNMKYNAENGEITKTFDIHPGLSFEFEYSFQPEKEASDDDNSDFNSTEDDSNAEDANGEDFDENEIDD